MLGPMDSSGSQAPAEQGGEGVAGGRLALARRARLKRDRVRGIDVLLAPELVLELNPQGAEILRLCDGTRSEDEVALAMAERYAHAGEGVGRDVRAFVARMLATRLLERRG